MCSVMRPLERRVDEHDAWRVFFGVLGRAEPALVAPGAGPRAQVVALFTIFEKKLSASYVYVDQNYMRIYFNLASPKATS